MSGVLSYCKIDKMKITPQMKNYLDRIQSRVELGNQLGVALASIPLLELFTQRVQAHKFVRSIGEYDWEEFAKVMSKVHFLTRNEVNRIADEARVFGSTNETKFWNCVYNATR